MPLSVPSGPYAISTLTLEIPARHVRSFSPEKFRLHNKEVFRMQTVLVTLFYPTSLHEDGQHTHRSNAASGISWLPHPRMKSMEGLVKYAGLSKYFAYPAVLVLPFSARLPYINDGPLAAKRADVQLLNASTESKAPASATPTSDRFPVGIFSHGLAGCRTTYSQYLAELASQGMVIASVEHRDGSAPSTTIQHERGKKEETLIYFKHEELEKDEQGQERASIMEMRKAQLELRQAEVMEAVHLLNQLDEGQGETLASSSTRQIDSKAKLAQWKDRLDLKNLWALGHSFGGATCIELIRRKDPIFTHSLVLDPWLEPIGKAGENGVAVVQRPLFVINSEAFTIWRSHFNQLRQLVTESQRQSGNAWLMTATKTAHTDFSDFPLLMPRFFKNKAGIPAESLITLFSQASQMAFSGSFDKGKIHFPIRDEIEGEVGNKDLGKGGEVVWHSLDGKPMPSSSSSSSRL